MLTTAESDEAAGTRYRYDPCWWWIARRSRSEDECQPGLPD